MECFQLFCILDQMPIVSDHDGTQIQMKHSEDGCSSITLNDTTSNIMQHSLDPDSKITLGHLSPERLSPNIFLSMNMDGVDERHSINVEWANYGEMTSTSSQLHQQYSHDPSISTPLLAIPVTHHNQYIDSNAMNTTNIINLNNCLNLDQTTSPYDDIKFLGVDHFNNMDGFKGDCILNMDQSIILDDKLAHSMGVSSVLMDEHADDLDMQGTFDINDPMEKTMPLLDLEKPVININIENLALNDVQHSQSNHYQTHQLK